VAMTWATIESALEGSRTAPEMVAALAGSCPVEIEEVLDRIGAGEAGRLLSEAQRAQSAERRGKLAACLAVLDKTVVAGGQTHKGALPRFGSRRRDLASRYGDLALCALLASLIDVELGGEPEARRARFARAAMALESHVAAVREGSAGEVEATEAEIRRAREIFARVGGLVRTGGD